MTRRAAISQAAMQRMKRAIEREGLPFRGFKTNPDGSVEALVGEPEALTGYNHPASTSDPLDDELATWATKHGYG